MHMWPAIGRRRVWHCSRKGADGRRVTQTRERVRYIGSEAHGMRPSNRQAKTIRCLPSLQRSRTRNLFQPKIYEILEDTEALNHNMIRVIDEEGERLSISSRRGFRRSSCLAKVVGPEVDWRSTEDPVRRYHVPGRDRVEDRKRICRAARIPTVEQLLQVKCGREDSTAMLNSQNAVGRCIRAER